MAAKKTPPRRMTDPSDVAFLKPGDPTPENAIEKASRLELERGERVARKAPPPKPKR